MRKLTKNRGFTLIELMVVVAIIGILAAVAVPKFLQFLQRSRKSEARTILTGVYNSAESYYAEYEWFGGTDVGIAWRIGFAPAGAMSIYTQTPTLGVLQNMCPPGSASACAFGAATTLSAAANQIYFLTANTTDAALAAPGVAPGGWDGASAAAPRGFGAAVCGNTDSDVSFDAWTTVNGARAPCNAFDDLSEQAGNCVLDPAPLSNGDPVGFNALGAAC